MRSLDFSLPFIIVSLSEYAQQQDFEDWEESSFMTGKGKTDDIEGIQLFKQVEDDGYEEDYKGIL